MFHVKQAAAPWAHVSRETSERLECFAALLAEWSARINLVSRADCAPDRLWPRHIADSLQLMPLLPPGLTYAIDLGSGGGLPGLVLAIATHIRFHLVEADQRKAAFLAEAARQTQAPVTVHAERVEAVRLPSAPLVTARAFAPLLKLLPLAAPLLAPDGQLLLPKGRTAAAELTAVATQWHMKVHQIPSQTDPQATILQLSEIRRAGPTS